MIVKQLPKQQDDRIEEIARIILLSECLRRFKWSPSEEAMLPMLAPYRSLAGIILTRALRQRGPELEDS